MTTPATIGKRPRNDLSYRGKGARLRKSKEEARRVLAADKRAERASESKNKPLAIESLRPTSLSDRVIPASKCFKKDEDEIDKLPKPGDKEGIRNKCRQMFGRPLTSTL